MVEVIKAEAEFLCVCVLNGFVLLMIYDVFRISRLVIKHSRVLIGIQDMFFGIASGIEVFIIVYKYNNGILRGFMIAAFGLGMLVYNKLFSRCVVYTISGVLCSIKKTICKMFKKIRNRTKLPRNKK